jgi:hypothetical protein
MLYRRYLACLTLATGLFVLGCGPDPATTQNGDDLTSASAVERELVIKGYVYADENASDYTIRSAVQRQVRTAFGPLRIAGISVDDREFKSNVAPSTFTEATLDVVKKESDDSLTVVKKTLQVSYTYKARALVDNQHASKTSISFALLMGNYQSFVSEIIKDCVENYEHDQEFSSSFWYVWAPNEYSCKTLINKEVDQIQQARQGLSPDQVSETEHNRRFLPVSAELEEASGPKTTYPEYDRLLGLDDSTRDRVIVYQIVGMASHAGDPEDEIDANDLKFKETFKLINILAKQWKSLKVADNSAVNPLEFTFKGQTYTATFDQLYSWLVSKSSFPQDLASEDRDAFRKAIHDHIYRKWITLEAPLVAQSPRGSKQLTLEVRLLYGSNSDYSVRGYFREAFEKGHVVLYMGHSYIGSGPLDPSNYTSTQFPDWYQIFLFQSCVSFNYYGVDYFDMKPGGTKNLDLVTNGVESWVVGGGTSMAQFIVALFEGSPKTWLSILEKTRYSYHDPNRNVDGEQDNTYDPIADPITISEAKGLSVKLTTSSCGSKASGTIQLSASAEGADRVEFFVANQKVGSDNQTPYAVSWDSTAVADGSVTVTAKAYASDGKTAEDSCTMTVDNSGPPPTDLFSDDMEGSIAWTATGLWHRATSSSCASPGYASAVTAWYFGQDSSCNYDTGSTTSGSLTSPTIAGVTSSSTLSFKFFRDVEQASGDYDETRVEVAVAGGNEWTTVWSKDSDDASAKAWTDSGALSLAAFAGKSIQIRFSFDSKDNYANEQVGWMVDDVRVTP